MLTAATADLSLTDVTRFSIATCCGVLLLTSCAEAPKSQPPKENKPLATTTKAPWGKTQDGKPVDLYTLTNANGMKARITNYGGIVVSLEAPDRSGKMGDVVLGFDSLDPYLVKHPYFGALVGRYGNRIGKAQFTLNGKTYKLAANNGVNALHGGLRGFDKVVWEAQGSPEGSVMQLNYLSKDGEEGYPGNLSVRVVYALTDSNELQIEYLATTDKDTPLNLTNHTYFNLAGGGDVLKHKMQIMADKFTPVDAGLIPTGELKPVAGTPFDFNAATEIGERIAADDEQIRRGGGYDHNFVLTSGGGKLAPAARVTEPTTGRVLEVLTTEPGVQFYTGNFLDGSLTGKGGVKYEKRSAFCLETQHFPDSPNKPNFPSAILRAGGQYKSTTVFRFSTAN